jgi:hypothetical protein
LKKAQQLFIDGQNEWRATAIAILDIKKVNVGIVIVMIRKFVNSATRW